MIFDILVVLVFIAFCVKFIYDFRQYSKKMEKDAAESLKEFREKQLKIMEGINALMKKREEMEKELNQSKSE